MPLHGHESNSKEWTSRIPLPILHDCRFRKEVNIKIQSILFILSKCVPAPHFVARTNKK